MNELFIPEGLEQSSIFLILLAQVITIVINNIESRGTKKYRKLREENEILKEQERERIKEEEEEIRQKVTTELREIRKQIENNRNDIIEIRKKTKDIDISTASHLMSLILTNDNIQLLNTNISETNSKLSTMMLELAKIQIELATDDKTRLRYIEAADKIVSLMNVKYKDITPLSLKDMVYHSDEKK